MLTKLDPKSLTLRTLGLSAIWAAASLFAAATVIITLNRNASEDSFKVLLSLHLDNLFGSVSAQAFQQKRSIPDLGDGRFLIPNSGWYWSVELVPESRGSIIQSPSLSGYGGRIEARSREDVPFEGVDFKRAYKVGGSGGEQLLVVEREADSVDANVALRYRVMGDLVTVDTSTADFRRKTYIYLALFGLGGIAINALVTLLGLRPLRTVGQSLKQIREGKSSRLEGEFPPEIAPLANEMNALIDNNRRIVERSRTQVGNLAHALKTPLAVMSNEGQALGGAKGAVIAEQTGAMQDQIQRYLQRARVSAQRDSVVYRAPVSPIIAQTLRVMQKLNPEKQFRSDLPNEELIFAGEAEDFQEIIGNLLENAAKWGRKRVELNASRANSVTGAHMLCVEIGDDGPGLTRNQIEAGIKRGKRMDESKPGTGLGLSIVSDTVREYGGELKLGKSALGGLSATITLPSVD